MFPDLYHLNLSGFLGREVTPYKVIGLERFRIIVALRIFMVAETMSLSDMVAARSD